MESKGPRVFFNGSSEVTRCYKQSTTGKRQPLIGDVNRDFLNYNLQFEIQWEPKETTVLFSDFSYKICEYIALFQKSPMTFSYNATVNANLQG